MSKQLYLKNNPYEKYFTRGQCLVDYTYMLTKTIAEIRKQRPNDTLHILEPTAGSKSLVIEFPNVVWHLYDIDPITDDIKQADFLTYDFNRRYDIICCNPPFRLKKQFAKKCMQLADNVIFISPANCLPYYEYSIKQIYSVCFSETTSIGALIGIWHYDKSKENKAKWQPADSHIRSALKKYTYDEFMQCKDPDRYIAFTYRSGHCRHYDIIGTEPPSLIDFSLVDEHNMLKSKDYEFILCDPNNRDNWISKATSSYIKKGQMRKLFLAKLKANITKEELLAYLNSRLDLLALRSLTASLLISYHYCPLNKAEAEYFFEVD